MDTYRCGIVGLSGIAASRPGPAPSPALGQAAPHSHAGGYALSPSTLVVAACDLRTDLIDDFRQRWLDVWPDVHGYTDYREMLSAERLDLLSVTTSDHRHAQIVVDAAEAGVRGIFCEKPIATSLADADRMIAACAAHGTVLLIDHTRRWYPEYAEAKRILDSGALGPLCRIVATLSGPRAMLFRNGTHLIDSICYFAGSEPVSVAGLLDDEQAHYGTRYAGDGGHDPATDPGGSGLVCFQNGVRAFINSSKDTMRDFEVDLWAEKGRIRLGDGVGELYRLGADGRPAMAPLARPLTTRADIGAGVLELVDLVDRGGVASSTPEDGRRALSIILGLLQSSAAGGAPVRFPVHDT